MIQRLILCVLLASQHSHPCNAYGSNKNIQFFDELYNDYYNQYYYGELEEDQQNTFRTYTDYTFDWSKPDDWAEIQTVNHKNEGEPYQEIEACTFPIASIKKNVCVQSKKGGGFRIKFKSSSTAAKPLHSDNMYHEREDNTINTLYDDMQLDWDNDADWSAIIKPNYMNHRMQYQHKYAAAHYDLLNDYAIPPVEPFSESMTRSLTAGGSDDMDNLYGGPPGPSPAMNAVEGMIRQLRRMHHPEEGTDFGDMMSGKAGMDLGMMDRFIRLQGLQRAGPLRRNTREMKRFDNNQMMHFMRRQYQLQQQRHFQRQQRRQQRRQKRLEEQRQQRLLQKQRQQLMQRLLRSRSRSPEPTASPAPTTSPVSPAPNLANSMIEALLIKDLKHKKRTQQTRYSVAKPAREPGMMHGAGMMHGRGMMHALEWCLPLERCLPRERYLPLG